MNQDGMHTFTRGTGSFAKHRQYGAMVFLLSTCVAAGVWAQPAPTPVHPPNPAHVHLVDADNDGLPDQLEKELLARYVPYLMFTNDGGEEQYRPMDAWQYVKWSELQSDGDEGKGVLLGTKVLFADPSQLLLNTGTDIKQETRFREHDRYLNPLKDVPTKNGNWARHGWAWQDVLAKRNVGLYGHVVPLTMSQAYQDIQGCKSKNSPLDDGTQIFCAIDQGPTAKKYIKVEYWQFFGFNEGLGGLGDHEGDWCSVQVVLDADTLAPVQVHHFFHGHMAAFDLRQTQKKIQINGNIQEWQGPNQGKTVSLFWSKGLVYRNPDADRNMGNNVVRFYSEAGANNFVHPVVYVEHGGHEFWPTDAWRYEDAHSHSGNDLAHSYLAAPPPNLGEVEVPLNEVPESLLVLRYNGKWGAYERQNSNPPGPPLHRSWTWPKDSSLRWLLHDLPY